MNDVLRSRLVGDEYVSLLRAEVLLRHVHYSFTRTQALLEYVWQKLRFITRKM